MLTEIPDAARAILEGDEVVFASPPAGWVVRIDIERLGGVGPWA